MKVTRWFLPIPVVALLAIEISAQPLEKGGALDGERFRVIVSTDAGGSDEDDLQSLVHYLVYADLFDTEGFISSPPGEGRKYDIDKVIDAYDEDFPKLVKHRTNFPQPDALRAVVKQGATDPAPKSGFSQSTEGSRWIVERALHKDADGRPLWVLVWGSITDLAQALHDAPEIKGNIRVYFIASWNRNQDPNSFRYIEA
ncbi:MAG: DUF1593 domain-containing protein, partial [Verrucomicrobiales bacterium]|nr:DUF1593 domain-containing protein [Verrucomicrobiales bacterium]